MHDLDPQPPPKLLTGTQVWIVLALLTLPILVLVGGARASGLDCQGANYFCLEAHDLIWLLPLLAVEWLASVPGALFLLAAILIMAVYLGIRRRRGP